MASRMSYIMMPSVEGVGSLLEVPKLWDIERMDLDAKWTSNLVSDPLKRKCSTKTVIHPKIGPH